MKRIVSLLSELWLSFLYSLPNTFSFNHLRARNIAFFKHMKIDKSVSISPNVRLWGNISIGKNSSIAYNCCFGGAEAGIEIGEDVMIGPNVVIVAFDHGFDDLHIPMRKQLLNQEKIIIENNVWIAANCTITKGVKIGTGSIIAANSVVKDDIIPFSIVAGVPGKIVKKRNDDSII